MKRPCNPNLCGLDTGLFCFPQPLCHKGFGCYYGENCLVFRLLIFLESVAVFSFSPPFEPWMYGSDCRKSAVW